MPAQPCTPVSLREKISAIRKYIVLLCTLTACTSCVSVVHDRTADTHEPAKVGLGDFAGTYRDEAVYFTPPNMMGLRGDTTLGGLLVGRKFGGDVDIHVTRSRGITVSCPDANFDFKPIHFTEGRDFKFENHSIVFLPDSDLGTADAPMIGYAFSKMTWFMDRKGRLVTLKGAGGGGLVGVVPVAVSGKTIAIFERRGGTGRR